MNRTDLIREFARIAHLSSQEAETQLSLLLELIRETLASGEPVMIRNFGKFEVRDRAATVRRNPKTGEDIKVPRKRAVLFRPAPTLKECANGERPSD